MTDMPQSLPPRVPSPVSPTTAAALPCAPMPNTAGRDHSSPPSVARPLVTAAQVIERLRDLPPIPAVVADLLTVIDGGEVSSDVIANKISQDQALAAKTLRLANSSFFGSRRRSTSMRDAVLVVGTRSVRMLATSAMLVAHLQRPMHVQFDFEAFWRHSIGTGIAAGLLARHVHMDEHNAFMGGLLHDIGRLVLITLFPVQYEEVLRRRGSCSALAAERELLGVDHVLVGVELANHWKFPPAITAAIARHHDAITEGPIELADLIRTADGVARTLGYFDEFPVLTPDDIAATLTHLRLSETEYRELIAQTDEQVADLSAILLGKPG